jgi:hypothetical protein
MIDISDSLFYFGELETRRDGVCSLFDASKLPASLTGGRSGRSCLLTNPTVHVSGLLCERERVSLNLELIPDKRTSGTIGVSRDHGRGWQRRA